MSPSSLSKSGSKSLGDLLSKYHIDVIADGSKGAKHLQNSKWHIPAGSYTARQIVQSCSPLLETVLYHLGPDSPQQRAREMLLDNLASNLSLDTRESTLLLPNVEHDKGRKEVAAQAVKIGKTIVQYAREVKHSEFDKELDIRSPCEGHLLSNAVASLMFGPRSQMHLMQLYNEYLHQMVLLRDTLLPFENYEDVIIPLNGGTRQLLGLRGTQQARSLFVAELMTRSISQSSVFQVARSLLAPELPSTGGYAFQYKHGSILPAFITGSKTFRLLRFVPAKLVENTAEVLFDYELQDYYTAARTEIAEASGILPAASWPPTNLHKTSSAISDCGLAVEKSNESQHSTVRLLKLRIEFEDGLCISVDFGQISRGVRYAYNSIQSTNGKVAENTADGKGLSKESYLHSASDVLTKSGSGLLISKKVGIHLIPTNSPIVRLALLGRLYPENTVLLPVSQSPQVVEKAGKSFSDSVKFVIYSEDE